MRGLSTLIRVARWRVDELRREILGVETRLAASAATRAALDQEWADEQQRAAADPVARYAYAGGYAARVTARRAAADADLAALRAALVAQRAELEAAFGALKRLELVRDRQVQRDAAEAARRDAIALDELSLEIHRRAQR
jgi:flagellar export protein FliJ